MPRLPVVALAVLLSTAVALTQTPVLSYDIVYVRCPRPGGDAVGSKFADVFRPYHVEPGCDLMLLRRAGTDAIADDTEEVLVAGGKGAALDPQMSFDGKSVYYSLIHDAVTLSAIKNFIPAGDADIYRIDLATRAITRLTQGEFLPNTSVRMPEMPRYVGVLNSGPTPVAVMEHGVPVNKIVFTSNRYGFAPTKGYTPVTSQLFAMNEDGSDVENITPMTLGAALHPFQRTTGEVVFSTYESQGLRDRRIWAFWSVWPDGRVFAPVISGFTTGGAFHFGTEVSDGSLVLEEYYNLNNFGFGTFHQIHPPSPTSASGFHPGLQSANPPVDYTNEYGSRVTYHAYPHRPTHMTTRTPFSTALDSAAGLRTVGDPPLTGRRLGKVTMPSGAPGNDLLLVWADGPVNALARPVVTPNPDAGIYIARGGGTIEHPDALILVRNDPRYNELWPRAVASYRDIYGIDAPHRFAYLPNDGSKHPSLPAGTPYGIVGTSGFYKRESFPGFAHPSISVDGLEAFNSPGDNTNSNWTTHGSDAGRYDNSEIASVRILLMEPQTDLSALGGPKFRNDPVNERLRILGEIPLRKENPDTSPLLDIEGNPDTSFWAKVPADTPFTFQMLDSRGRVLTMAQTWHQVRPGEVRVDCGGCHAHSSVPLDFATTAAAKLPPTDLTLQPAHDVEFIRDINPILQAKCVSCHAGTDAPASLRLDGDAATNYIRLANDRTAQFGLKPPVGAYQQWVGANASRYVRLFQSRRSLLVWKLAGARLDGWMNDRNESTAPFQTALGPFLWDLDYVEGPVNHASMLTAAEQRLIATWIDLAAPIDEGGGYWRDENRPTLAIHFAAGRAIVGAADAYSGLDKASLTITVDGAPVTTGLAVLPGDRWDVPLPAGVSVRVGARIKDVAGNWHELTRLGPGVVVVPPPPPIPPSGLLTPSSLSILAPQVAQVATRLNPPSFTWAPVPGAVSYEVQVGTSSGHIIKYDQWVLSTTMAMSAGMPDAPYSWRVRACGAFVSGAPPAPTDTTCSFGALASNWTAWQPFQR